MIVTSKLTACPRVAARSLFDLDSQARWTPRWTTVHLRLLRHGLNIPHIILESLFVLQMTGRGCVTYR